MGSRSLAACWICAKRETGWRDKSGKFSSFSLTSDGFFLFRPYITNFTSIQTKNYYLLRLFFFLGFDYFLHFFKDNNCRLAPGQLLALSLTFGMKVEPKSWLIFNAWTVEKRNLRFFSKFNQNTVGWFQANLPSTTKSQAPLKLFRNLLEITWRCSN